MEGGGGEKAEGEKGVKGRGAIRGGEREGTGREGEERKKGWNEENGGGKLEQGRRLAKAGPEFNTRRHCSSKDRNVHFVSRMAVDLQFLSEKTARHAMAGPASRIIHGR